MDNSPLVIASSNLRAPLLKCTYFICVMHMLEITGFPENLLCHWLSFMDEVCYLGNSAEEGRQRMSVAIQSILG